MTAKKRKSIEKCEKNVDILWSSSSSSSENEDNFADFRKMVKANGVGFKRARIGWINTTTSAQSASTLSGPASSSTPTSTTNNTCGESPVINSFNIELSPAFNYNSDDTSGMSPVIRKKQLVRSLKIVSPPNEKSPEIVSGISSVESDCSGSPHVNISQSSFAEDTNVEPIQFSSTQKSCESYSEGNAPVDTDTHCTNESSDMLYHCTKPRKKKHKKGTIAYLLDRAIQKQKANIGIWQHEEYLRNNKGDLEGEFCTFSVEHKWKEYGCDIVECVQQNDETNTTRTLLLVNSSNTLGVTLEVNDKFRLYPPFNKKKVKYKSVLIDCYFNVSKITVVR